MSKWSIGRINYVNSLSKKSDIFFADITATENYSIKLPSDKEDYDLIICYIEKKSVYIIAEAPLHKTQKTLSVKCVSDYVKNCEKNIKVAYKSIRKDSKYERIYYVPENKSEIFFKSLSYYLNDYEKDENKLLWR